MIFSSSKKWAFFYYLDVIEGQELETAPLLGSVKVYLPPPRIVAKSTRAFNIFIEMEYNKSWHYAFAKVPLKFTIQVVCSSHLLCVHTTKTRKVDLAIKIMDLFFLNLRL